MRKFYCNGKQGFCHRGVHCISYPPFEDCEFLDKTGGRWMEDNNDSNLVDKCIDYEPKIETANKK